MKNALFSLVILTFTIFLQSCDVNDYYYDVDYTAPAPPSDITVYNGNSRVDLTWQQNLESDLAGYNIYYSDSYDGRYELIGSSYDNYFIDYDAANGNRYYYAITAFDYNSNESELSYDVAYGIARPEGFNQSIFDFRRFPNNSGFSFTDFNVVAYNSSLSDFFYENYEGVLYLNVWDDTDIQDMGFTNDIYDIPFAPVSGWASEKYVEVKTGHTYVIWTWDNHFAKVRVSSFTGDRVVFDWAFQLIEGETMLKLKNNAEVRNALTLTNPRFNLINQ